MTGARGSEHCWHKGNYGFSHGGGGSWEYFCCWCGTRVQRGYHDDSGPVEGHGPNYLPINRRNDPLPETECLARPRTADG